MFETPRCANLQLGAGASGRQFLGVAWSGLHNLGAGLTTGDVDDGHDVSCLVIAHASHGRPLLPLGAIRVALDLPFAMEHRPVRRLVKSRAILGPIDYALAGLPACGSGGGLQVDSLA